MLSAGLPIGLYALVVSGERWIPDASESPDWLTDWTFSAGLCLLGLILLAASSMALRNRRRAGLVFLICAPMVAFCLAYPQAHLWVTEADGVHDYRPSLPAALILGFLFFLPFLAALLAIRNRKRAALLFVVLAPLAALLLCLSPFAPGFIPELAAWSAPFVVFGCFWLATAKLRWLPLLAPRTRTLRTRLATALAGCLVVAALDLAGTLALVARHSSSGWTGDCGSRGPSLRPRNPGHTAFTARLILVGHRAKVSGRWGGNWAIGIIQERFWGWPSWAPPFVLLIDNAYFEGKTYFVDGRRNIGGLLTRILPIVGSGRCGNLAGPVALLAPELHLLRHPAQAAGSRLIGRVIKQDDFAYWYAEPPKALTVFAGVTVRVTGSSGTRFATTDSEGIYEVDGLPPDSYIIEVLGLPDTRIAWPRKIEVTKADLVGDRAIEVWHTVDWNGTMEGQVRDAAGAPAHVHLELRELNTPLIRVAPVETGADGAFRIAKLSPGHYLLIANPDGPDDNSPYAGQFFPAVANPQDEGLFAIGEGQHIRNLSYSVKRLAPQNLQVRVTWPNGQPVDAASVYVAYEDAHGYEPIAYSRHTSTANRDGRANIHVFGNSRIRVWAMYSHWDGTANRSNFSPALEFAADKLPRHLDLVLSSSELSLSRSQTR